jgi:hypothetical protein
MPGTLSFAGALEIASLLYLALPWFVFAFGWLRLPYAFLLWIVLGVALLEQGRRAMGDSQGKAFARPRFLELGALVLLVALWTALSGAGGWGYQNLDWKKHDMILRDLIEHSWPVDYLFVRAEGSTSVPLVYYVAYYLPAALIGKLAGWRAANEALFAHTFAGAVLAALWFGRLSRRNVLLAASLFVCLGGLDVIGFRLWTDEPLTATTHLEWWAGLMKFQYSSDTSLLFWVPQHALAGWILTGLLLYQADVLRSCRAASFAVGLCLLWSPFVALGLVPFALAAAVRCRFRGASSFANVAGGPALVLVAAAFLFARSQPIPHGWWFQTSASGDWPTLGMFYLLEFGAIAVFSMPARRADGPARVWWWTSLASLLVLPLYRVGLFNDFTMRASIPALFVFWSFVAAKLLARPWHARARVLFALVLLGACTAGTEIARSITKYPTALPEEGDVTTFADNLIARAQYLGDGGAWFFRRLGAPTREVVTIEAETPIAPKSAIVVGAAAASAGNVARLADGNVSIVYGFETSRRMPDPLLLARYTTRNHCSLEIFLDEQPAAEMRWRTTGGRWAFAVAPLEVGPLAAGFHRLSMRGCAGAQLDMFVLARDSRRRR